MIGYQTMLWGDFKYGLMMKVIGGLLTVPFAIKLKLWDVLFLCAFFGISEISKISSQRIGGEPKRPEGELHKLSFFSIVKEKPMIISRTFK